MKRTINFFIWVVAMSAASLPAAEQPPTYPLTGVVVDAATREPLATRIYILGDDGSWHFPQSAAPEGTAIRYERTNWSDAKAFEKHTTLSAHPFRVELPEGHYVVTVERGKEYRPAIHEVDVGPGERALTIALERWIDMAGLGWFSGDTHVHRRPDALSVTQLSEDLNVAFPMIDWASRLNIPPTESHKSTPGDFESRPTIVDPTHVWYPRNTEFEISLGEDDVLGAFLVLNHQTRFEAPVFPLRKIEAQAHAEGALIDLEKHNWAWTVALAPLLKADLFPLSNNHVWRTKFVTRDYAVPAPDWMGLEGTGMDTERGWVLFGFESYYALLNSGFRLNPSAGSANGVHPVPLGFSRVYVHLDEAFSYDAWMRGLGAGRSFVTNGPMLFGTVDGKKPGHVFAEATEAKTLDVACRVVSEHPLETIQLIANGRVYKEFEPQNRRTETGAYESEVAAEFTSDRSAWLAWRSFEQRPEGRFRFAHTAPWHLPVAGAPLRPRREQIEWLIQCVEEEIVRRDSVWAAPALAQYGEALAIYRRIAEQAEDNDTL